MSLKTKFHLASSCLILMVVIGMMASLFVYEKKRLLAEIDQQQIDDLDKLARVCEDAMIVFDEPALFKYAKNLVSLSAPKVVYAGFIYHRAADGSPWLWNHNSDRITYVDMSDPNIQAVLDSHRLSRRNITVEGERVSELSRPVGRIGYVRLGYSQDVVDQLFKQTVKRSLERFSVVGLIAILFGLILAQFFSVALSRPIQNLMQAAESIANGQKGVMIPVNSNDELGKLTKTFNHMSEELIKLDELKDEFMSHVTHELRSPLTSIIATVELMAEMPITNKDPKVRRSVDRLIFGSERLNRLVDNILDLTRMEAGKMSFDIQPVNIGAIVSEMADFFEPRAMEKELKIQAIVPPQFPLVMADAERIRQVISNLIHNAIKFTNTGGLVLWVREQNGMAAIGVQDTGVGIPKDKLDSVFKKFECLKDTRDRVEKPVPGSGLGLNIVQNSIKAQGGRIWVESEIDKGSTFIFELPFAPAEKQIIEPVTAPLSKAMTVPPQIANPRHAVVMSKGERLL